MKQYTTLKCKPCPKYFGVQLDRSLFFNAHINNLNNKVWARVCLLRHLASIKWGLCVNVLKRSALALVYASAEYC